MGAIDLMGYMISSDGIQGDVATAFDAVQSGKICQFMVCVNPHSLVVASNDELFRSALRNADIVAPDGSGILIAAKILNKPMHERVAGYEFFKAFSDYVSLRGGARYFFLGSSRKVLDLIVKRLQGEYSNITVCGTYSPPFSDVFSDQQNVQIIDAINLAAPDVLWVGMTAPKQEKWIYQNKDRLNVSFIGAIGAVFDFYAGTIKRSSPFWQSMGLEWLPRLLREPKRLWKRNLVSTPIFLYWVMKEKMKQIRKPGL